MRRQAVQIFEKPRPAILLLTEGLGCEPEEAMRIMRLLVEGGYGIAPRNPTNGMVRASLEAMTPPTGHEQVITAISKARLRWQAMLDQGTAVALSRKYIEQAP